MRLDKWLWAARFFKTRTLAAKACDLNRVQANQQPGRPAREVRGPAPVAQTLYRETEQSREARARLAAERKAGVYFEPAPAARPSKRDRRLIHRFRGN